MCTATGRQRLVALRSRTNVTLKLPRSGDVSAEMLATIDFVQRFTAVEIARVLVYLDHLAGLIEIGNHNIM
jgi:hypothetical protein